MGLSAELCVYIAFKGLHLPAPAVSLQTPNSLKPVRAGDFSGPVSRMPIQLVSSIHLMRREEEESSHSSRGNSSSHFFSGVGTNWFTFIFHFPTCSVGVLYPLSSRLIICFNHTKCSTESSFQSEGCHLLNPPEKRFRRCYQSQPHRGLGQLFPVTNAVLVAVSP